MFSNVIRNLDIDLLRQQESLLTHMILDQKIPLNHPLCGLLGLVVALILERNKPESRTDISMNFRKDKGRLFVNFHSSIKEVPWEERMSVALGLLILSMPTESSQEDYLDLVGSMMDDVSVVRFGT